MKQTHCKLKKSLQIILYDLAHDATEIIDDCIEHCAIYLRGLRIGEFVQAVIDKVTISGISNRILKFTR